jgi:hypothetical protein
MAITTNSSMSVKLLELEMLRERFIDLFLHLSAVQGFGSTHLVL